MYELHFFSCRLFENENLFTISKIMRHISLMMKLHGKVCHMVKLHDLNRVNIVVSFHQDNHFETFCCL